MAKPRRAPAADLVLTPVDLLGLAVGAGPAVREFRFMAPERQFRFDRSGPGLRVAFEYEGGTWVGAQSHASGAGIERDCIKYTEAQLRGWIVVRATASMLRKGTALALLDRALRLRMKGAST